MKITKRQLKQLINEEIEVLNEEETSAVSKSEFEALRRKVASLAAAVKALGGAKVED